MGFNIADILGGGILGQVKGIIGSFKLDPETKAKLDAAVDERADTIKLKDLEIQSKVQDAISDEIAAASTNIQAEAKSQSWIPRNVRPLLLLMWGSVITFNPISSIVSQFMAHPIQPITLDPWIYKLTAIGFTGYATLRTFEKWQEKDN